MLLIVYYVVFMIVGDFASYFLGLFVEYAWGPVASLGFSSFCISCSSGLPGFLPCG